jgi:hypothetical protein
VDRLYALLFAAFMTLVLVSLIGAWAKGIADVMKARRVGAIRSRAAVGQTVYRSTDPAKFRSTLGWRIVWLAAAPIGLMWLAFLTVIAIASAAVSPG